MGHYELISLNLIGGAAVLNSGRRCLNLDFARFRIGRFCADYKVAESKALTSGFKQIWMRRIYLTGNGMERLINGFVKPQAGNRQSSGLTKLIPIKMFPFWKQLRCGKTPFRTLTTPSFCLLTETTRGEVEIHTANVWCNNKNTKWHFSCTKCRHECNEKLQNTPFCVIYRAPLVKVLGLERKGVRSFRRTRANLNRNLCVRVETGKGPPGNN